MYTEFEKVKTGYLCFVLILLLFFINSTYPIINSSDHFLFRITSVRWKIKPCIPEEKEEDLESDDSDKTVIESCDNEELGDYVVIE